MNVRAATPQDAHSVATLLDAFNAEYDDFTPRVEFLTRRLERLIATDAATVILAVGDEGEPSGLAVLRFRQSLWQDAPDTYLEELYVVPGLRGQGIGLALMERAIETARERGSKYMDLGTSEDDVAARGLYKFIF